MRTSYPRGRVVSPAESCENHRESQQKRVVLGTRMTAYILRRLLLIVPTMIGIMLVTFVIVQFAPGGPVERLIAQLTGTDPGATAQFSGGGGDFTGRPGQGGIPGDVSAPSKYRGAQGLDPEFIKSLEKQFGFDKPAYERFGMMLWNYLRFDFGDSYFQDKSVLA